MAIDSLLSAGEDHYSRRVACFPDPVFFCGAWKYRAQCTM